MELHYWPFISYQPLLKIIIDALVPARMEKCNDIFIPRTHCVILTDVNTALL